MLGLVDENSVNQWIRKSGWKTTSTGNILISNQDENIKTKKITEIVELEAVAGIMASSFKESALGVWLCFLYVFGLDSIYMIFTLPVWTIRLQ